jgi:F-type H+-transporting ATPase subunit a
MEEKLTIYAEKIFSWGTFDVTNSMIATWLSLAIVIGFVSLIKVRKSGAPKGVQNLFEMVLEGAAGLAESVTGSKERAMLFLPFILPLFFFILLNNWLGLLPGVGSIGFEEGGRFVPLFRAATADLNTTLALSITALIITHFAGIMLTSLRAHTNRFLAYDSLLKMPGEIKRGNYQAIIVNPIKFFVGLIEFIGELSKTASLSLRLFGNVLAGEILLGTMMSLFAFALPVPLCYNFGAVTD